jgi:hypothetical protein
MKDYHYVECHVVVTGDTEGLCLPHAERAKWWSARLSEDGSEEEHPGDLILTTRRKTPEDAVNAIRTLAADLRSRGFSVTRGKTEIVAFDSKHGDSLV